MKLRSLYRSIIIFDMVQYFCIIVIVPNEPRTYTISLEPAFVNIKFIDRKVVKAPTKKQKV